MIQIRSSGMRAMVNKDTKKCNKCEKVKDVDEFTRRNPNTEQRIYRCKVCVAEYSREYYRKNKEKVLTRTKLYAQNHKEQRYQTWKRQWEIDPQKTRARNAVRYAKATGKLVRQPCEKCGSDNTDFHHTDGYEWVNQLRGIWLCKQHHADEHVKLSTWRKY